MEVIAVAGYEALSDVYEWLIGDDKLTPAQAEKKQKVESRK